MRPIKIIEEMQRQQWAMTVPALRSMLAIIDGEEISVEEHSYFHALEAEQRAEVKATFGRAVDGTQYTSTLENVGFIEINGPIIPRATAFSNVSGVASIDRLTSEFKALENNPRIDAIALMIDSPGGAVTGTADFASLVKASQKKTYSFSWMAASALYWIASATDEMVAADTGLVGSIGAILSMTDSSEADRKKGLRTVDIVSSQSPNKLINPDDPESLASLQQVVDDQAAVFVEAVAINRNVSVEKVLSDFGAGSLVVAERALNAGMIDRITDVDSFVKGITKANGWSRNSVAAETVKGVALMSDDVKTLTVEEIRTSYPEAVGQIEAAAKSAECARLQAIEGLGNKFNNALPAVKAAATAEINRLKYADGATEASVSAALLEVVANAQIKAVETVATEPRAAAALAAELNTPAPKVDIDPEVESTARVNAMVTARKEREGGR